MILQNNELPDWFEYPSEFKVLIEQNLLDFDPWIILTDDRLRTRFEGVKKRYPKRNLVPFARREDNDDLACFEKGKSVVVIHDFASEGYEGGKESIEFWDWLRKVVEEMIDYNS
jgi:hypothetical protein